MRKMPSALRIFPQMGYHSEKKHVTETGKEQLIDLVMGGERQKYDGTYAYERCFEKDYANNKLITKPMLIHRKFV